MDVRATCSSRKVTETYCSEIMEGEAHCSRRKVVETNCSRRKVVETNCSKNIEEEEDHHWVDGRDGPPPAAVDGRDHTWAWGGRVPLPPS